MKALYLKSGLFTAASIAALACASEDNAGDTGGAGAPPAVGGTSNLGTGGLPDAATGGSLHTSRVMLHPEIPPGTGRISVFTEA